MPSREFYTLRLVAQKDRDAYVLTDKAGNRLEYYTGDLLRHDGDAQVYEHGFFPIHSPVVKSAAALISKLEEQIPVADHGDWMPDALRSWLDKQEKVSKLKQGIEVRAEPGEIGRLVPPNMRYRANFDPRNVPMPAAR